MARIRQLLTHASVEVAVRRRICHHARKKHSIPAATKALVIKDPASGGSKNYCPECAAEILAQVEVDLVALRAQLSEQ